MATTYKVLGQSAPADTNNADLYTVPAATAAVVSTISVSNVTATDATCRVFVRQAGAAASASNAIIYDGNVAANDLIALTIGVTLAATDVISVQSSSGSALTFQAFGSEIS